MKENDRKKQIWWKGLLLAVMVIGLIPLLQLKPVKAATETVSIQVTYEGTKTQTLYQLMNAGRQAASASALTYDYTLESLASERVAEIALDYTKRNSNATSGTLAGEADYCMTSDAASVYAAWKQNSSIDAYMHTDSNCNAVGISHGVYNGRDYWVALFASSASSVPNANVYTTLTKQVMLDTTAISNRHILNAPTTLNMNVGETYDLSKCKASIQVSGHYPAGEDCPVDGSVSAVAADTSVVACNGTVLSALKAGTTDVTITCGGQTAITTVIVAQPTLANATISAIPDQTFTGYAICPALTVYINGAVLRENTDYTVSYTNNVNIGTATATITGIGRYSGVRTVNFRITGPNLSVASIAAIPDQLYTGSDIRPSLTVTVNNITLTQNVDYSVSYSNNRNAGTATVTVTGKGNYSGNKTTTFRILAKNISNTTVSSIDTQRYTGKDVCPAVVVQIGSVVLVRNVDYTLFYQDNRSPGTASVTINGAGTYTGSKTVTFKIAQLSLSSATIKISSTPVYNGEEKTPGVTVKLDGRTLEEDEDYEVDYRNNVKPGKATVVISGLGDYRGSKKAYFVIRPGKPVWRSAKAKGDRAVLSWKQDKYVKGYELYRSKDSSFDFRRRGTLTKNTNTLCQDPKLSPGTYYYKLRSYMVVNGKTYYSAFSKIKKVKIRK